MRRPIIAIASAALAFLTAGAPASASPKPTAAAPSCVVSGSAVNALGLPTDEVINFLVTDSSGTTGWVLGFTPDGRWSVQVSAPAGPTTYQFISRTWGPHGSKYNVFAACS